MALATAMEQLSKQVNKTFYPRLALYEALARVKDEHQSRRPLPDSETKERRKFLNSFAYLCDTHKGGTTVTAAALQDLQSRNVLWLAANEGIREEVRVYAEHLVRLLVNNGSESEVKVRDDIFDLVVKMCTPRLEYYRRQIQWYATTCRMKLRKELPDETAVSLRKTLKKLSESPVTRDLGRLVDTCYEMREDQFQAIKERQSPSEVDFVKLAHYIWRLGATRSSVNAVVRAMSNVLPLRQISRVCFISAPEARIIHLHPNDVFPYAIVREISTDSGSQNITHIESALRSLVRTDLPVAGGMDNPLRQKMAKSLNIVTRVHAELQIADLFSRQACRNFVFVDNDKFIGCSKPACYFCYNWLSNHKHGYVPPVTHNRIIPGCRGPDQDINESGVAVLSEMYSKMTRRVGQDIIAFLRGPPEGADEGKKRGRPQYMSTEGGSRGTSVVSRT